MELKDFDITQISKDTKIVVFKTSFKHHYGNEQALDELLFTIKRLKNDLENIGVTALFIDEAFDVTPLTDEMLSSGRLKTI